MSKLDELRKYAEQNNAVNYGANLRQEAILELAERLDAFEQAHDYIAEMIIEHVRPEAKPQVIPADKDCPDCAGTGWCGDNGPGIKGNKEYARCNCTMPVGKPQADEDAVVLSLTLGQASVIHAALEQFISYLNEGTLGTDKHGKAISRAYLDSTKELINIIVKAR